MAIQNKTSHRGAGTVQMTRTPFASAETMYIDVIMKQ